MTVRGKPWGGRQGRVAVYGLVGIYCEFFVSFFGSCWFSTCFSPTDRRLVPSEPCEIRPCLLDLPFQLSGSGGVYPPLLDVDWPRLTLSAAAYALDIHDAVRRNELRIKASTHCTLLCTARRHVAFPSCLIDFLEVTRCHHAPINSVPTPDQHGLSMNLESRIYKPFYPVTCLIP